MTFSYFGCMVRIVQIACLFVAVSASQAISMTGAELLQTDDNFARGYIFGITEYRITVINQSDAAFYKTRKCIIESKMNSDTMYGMVKSHFLSHPELLPMPAAGGIANAYLKMCENYPQ
jgi:hypothetical protein